MTLTVSQLNRYVKSLFEEDPHLQDIFLRGEISNFKNHYTSGHFYFTLIDKKAQIRCVMFRGHAQHVPFEPEEGMEVLVRGSVNLYEAGGSYQFYAVDMQPYGVGAMEIALRQLREKLELKGYFDVLHKKNLPKFPTTIGVITSKTGAAFGDITQVLTRRYPLAQVLFAPAIVQGAEAAPSLITALKLLDGRCDVIIIGRGGGSKEDLWAFNDEKLADAIFAATTPLISAVGHEMDVTICDLVADHRAPTPSAAAELAVPNQEDLFIQLEGYHTALVVESRSMLSRYEQRLKNFEKQEVLKNPFVFIKKKQELLDLFAEKLYTIQGHYFEKQQRILQEKAAVIDSLSPLAVLSRGYSAVYKDGSPIYSAADLQPQDQITIRLHKGSVKAEVLETTREG